MSNALLLNYDITEEDNLDKASKVLSKKEKDDLTSDYGYCVIEGCLDHALNRMIIPDLANYLPSYVCNKHRDDLLKRYYERPYMKREEYFTNIQKFIHKIRGRI